MKQGIKKSDIKQFCYDTIDMLNTKASEICGPRTVDNETGNIRAEVMSRITKLQKELKDLAYDIY